MRAYLLTSGTIFTLVAAMHFFITFEHWRMPQSDLWFVLGPAVIAILSTGLASWAFRLMRGAGAAAA